MLRPLSLRLQLILALMLAGLAVVVTVGGVATPHAPVVASRECFAWVGFTSSWHASHAVTAWHPWQSTGAHVLGLLRMADRR